jgi:rhamnogalacturonyl hydrolase YesR/beta-xylosidase/lysophospholipase L1-like esterase
MIATLLLAALSYRNPIIFADYSDPDVIRVGSNYYLVASSFQCVPGLPILTSQDLVHWQILSYALDRLPSPDFDGPQHGNGLWAPSLRYHGGFFWIYVGDPDRGIFMTRARDPRGPWEPLTLIKDAKGWIDPCPLWDDDGSVYLVHAWAKSRVGFNSILTVNRLSADGRHVVDDGTMVFDGHDHHPTIEGPKFYKRNGWYYIFAPAGGVKNGWQTVLRSKNILGPYEDKIVLEDGNHQGAWVEAADGSSWFVHFKDRGAYGRLVYLRSMTWINDWPEMRVAPTLLSVPAQTGVSVPQKTGLEWQWLGNPSRDWLSFHMGAMRLKAAPVSGNLWSATNLLLQKLPAPSFNATTRVDASGLQVGERAGLVVMGADYSALIVERTQHGFAIHRVVARDADKGSMESDLGSVEVSGPTELRVSIAPEAVCRFSYRGDDGAFHMLGGAFVARPGRWIGAKVGIFAEGKSGHADFSFHIEPTHPTESASLIVAQDGSGDYKTIQEAIDAIPADNAESRIILIRNGTYNEKVRISTSHIALVGENREKTRIEFAELRRNWRASHPDDWGAAVININATDVIIANLTVHNTFGGDHDHQFAIRSMDNANRIAILSANVIADGGDTLSLWNSESGLSYYADSYFEGWVDYLCPRGWAYVTNSRFFGHNSTASIWHDGSKNKNQKFVIRHSQFDGVPGFALGRNHRDAQFYLLDAEFSSNMADKPIYPSPAPDPRQWGERYYYSNAHRDGGDFAWFADNLRTARDEDITATWAFDGQWDPAKLPAVLPFAAIPNPENGARWVDPAGVTLRWTPSRNASTQHVLFCTTPLTRPSGPPSPGGRGTAPGPSPTGRGCREAAGEGGGESEYDTGALEPGKTYYWRIDDGPVWSFRTDPRTIRIALVGDSTMNAGTGWGDGFKANLDQSIAFINAARNGRSSKSYAAQGHWTEILKHKPAYILIQFGHNDVPGKGLDRETDLPTFRANMARYVEDARAAGAKPILVTPLTRRYFGADGRIHSDLMEHAKATTEVAADKNVPLIDLHAKSIELLERLGPSISPAISPRKTDGTIDKTHLNAQGSALFGALMAGELRHVIPELAPFIAEPKLQVIEIPWSVRMADSVMQRTPDPLLLDVTNNTPKWDYTQGLVLLAIEKLAERNGDARYAKYVKAYYDGMIDAEGKIRAYKIEEYSLDRINAGKVLFAFKEEKYRKAIETLRQQFRGQPRNSDGGFWHKQRYPHQMWLDGLYMGAPFLAQYARVFHEPAAFDDVITQFVLMEKHARDEKTGLLYHGYDESRQQKWADPKTGRSPALWGRAMGWYAMGLVETLDYIPYDHRRRGELIAILQRFAEAITKVQDPQSGVWWLVVDQPGREGNYLESSSSSMFCFVLLKASRLGYIDAKYADAGRRAYAGILKEFIEVDKDGLTNINRAIAVAGLGGDPEKERYRDGTFEYYAGEKVRSNDPKAVGPFIFASLEMER